MTRDLKIILNNIQQNLAVLASRTTNRDSDNESRISSIETDVTEVIARVSEQDENIETNEVALNYVTEQLLPDQSDRTDELEAAVDYILTEIIPEIIN